MLVDSRDFCGFCCLDQFIFALYTLIVVLSFNPVTNVEKDVFYVYTYVLRHVLWFSYSGET